MDVFGTRLLWLMLLMITPWAALAEPEDSGAYLARADGGDGLRGIAEINEGKVGGEHSLNPCGCPPGNDCIPTPRVGFLWPAPGSTHLAGSPVGVAVYACDFEVLGGGPHTRTSVQCPGFSQESTLLEFSFTPPAAGQCNLVVNGGGGATESTGKAAKALSQSLTITIQTPAPILGRPGPTTAPPCAPGVSSCASIPNQLVFLQGSIPQFWVKTQSLRPVTSVRFRLEGNDIGQAEQLSSDLFAISLPALTASSMQRSLTATATNDVGISSTSEPTRFVVVTSPPRVTLDRPVTGSVFKQGSVVDAFATAQGSNLGVFGVEFFRNGVSVPIDGFPPFQHSFTNLPLGKHIIQARVIDSSGLSAVSAPSVITVVANQPPSVTLAALPGPLVPGLPVALRADANDPDGRIASVEFFVGGVSVGSDTEAPYAVEWQTTGSYAGQSNVQVSAVATDDGPIARTATSLRTVAVSPNVAPTISAIAGQGLLQPATVPEAFPFIPEGFQSVDTGYRWSRNIYGVGQTLRLEVRVVDPDRNMRSVAFFRRWWPLGHTGVAQQQLIATSTRPVSTNASDGSSIYRVDVAVQSEWAWPFLTEVYAEARDAVGATTASIAAPVAFMNASSFGVCGGERDDYCGTAPTVVPPAPTQGGQEPTEAVVEAERYDQGTGQGASYFVTGRPINLGYSNAHPEFPRGDDVRIRRVGDQGGLLPRHSYLYGVTRGQFFSYSLQVRVAGMYLVDGCIRWSAPSGAAKSGSPLVAPVPGGTSDGVAPSDLAGVVVERIIADGKSQRFEVVQDVAAGRFRDAEGLQKSSSTCATEGGWVRAQVSSRGWFLQPGAYRMRTTYHEAIGGVSPSPSGAGMDVDRLFVRRVQPTAARDVTLEAPQSGAAFRPGATVGLRAVVSPPDGVQRLEFQIARPGSQSDSAWSVIGSAAPTLSTTQSWTVEGNRFGAYVVRACAWHGPTIADRTCSSHATIDVSPFAAILPSLSLEQPNVDDVLSLGRAVALVARVTIDAPETIARVEFEVERDGAVIATVAGIAGPQPRYSATWTPAVAGPFRYRVRASTNSFPNTWTQSPWRPFRVTAGGAESGLASPNLPSYEPVPAIDSSSQLVASSAGSFRVDESGAATYSIPLAMAPGLGGVVPQLSLSYSSGAGEGMLGVGWAVSGLHAISRCRKSIEAGDAFSVANAGNTEVTELGHKPLRFFPASGSVDPDQFCLDGQRLLRIDDAGSASHGAVGAQYRTEIDDFTYVTVVDDLDTPSVNAGPEQFRVERKDGSVLTFGGLTARSTSGQPRATNARLPVNEPSGPTSLRQRVESGRGAIMTWALSRMEDRLGNAIHYFYEYPNDDAAAGEQYIKEIHYTVPGGGSTLSPRSRVVFHYATVGADVSFVSGMRLQRSRRLERIEVFNDGNVNPIRAYLLGYEARASVSGRDRLASVQECVDAAGTVCYPRTRFEWTDGVLGVARSEASNIPNEVHVVQPPGGGEPAPHAIKYGDLNGDGLTDLVWARNVPNSENQEICWAIAQATGFTYATGCNSELILFQRLNRNPRVGPEGMFTVASNLAFHLYDFSGDGRDDLLIAQKDAAAWRVYVSDGSGFAPGSAVMQAPKAAGISTGGTGEVQLADFNGDGLLDAIYGVGPGTGGVGGGGSGGDVECPGCLPNRNVGTNSTASALGFRGISDPATGVRPVISYMATARPDGSPCSSGLKYCFSQTATVGGRAATSLPALVGHSTACGTASSVMQDPLGPPVRFDGGIEVLDFDGDGLNDLVAKAAPGDACGQSVAAAWVIYRNAGWSYGPNGQPDPLNPEIGLRHTFVRVFAQRVGAGESNGAPNIDTGAQIGWRPVETNDHRFVTGDLNGDGLTDLLYRGRTATGARPWYYRLSMGRVRPATLPGGQLADGLSIDFAPAVALDELSASGVEERTVTLADVNGDGAAEVIFGADVGSSITGRRDYRALTWNGSGFQPLQPFVLPNVQSSRDQNSERSVFLDLDGDGRLDQVVADYEDHTPGKGEIILRRASPGVEGTTPRRYLPLDHVYQIVDGFGAATSIQYSPLTVLATYLPGRSSAGRAVEFGRGSNVFDLRHAQYVVRTVASSAPRLEDPLAVSRVAYRYRGARMQMGGRGFLGFEEIQTLDLQSLVESSTTYAQTFPLVGMPISTWSRALDHTRLAQSGWAVCQPHDEQCRAPVVTCAAEPSGVACFGFRADGSRMWPAGDDSPGLMMSESSDRYGFAVRSTGGYVAPINTATAVSLPGPSALPAPVFRFKASSESTTYDLGPTKTQIEDLRNETYDAHGNVTRLVARRKNNAGTTLREAVTENVYGASVSHQRFGRLSSTVVTTNPGPQEKVRRVAFRYHEPSLLLRAEVVEPTGAADRVLVTTHSYNSFGNKEVTATCSAHHLPGAVSSGNVVVDTAVAQCAQTDWTNVAFGGNDLVVRRYAKTTFAANDPRYVVSEQAPFATSGTAATEQTVSTIEGRDRFGNPTEIVEINGLRTRFGYDAFGAKYFESTNAGTSTRTVRRFCSGSFDGSQPRWGATIPPQVASCPAGAVVRVDTLSAGAPAQTVFLDVLGREMRSVTQGFRANQFVVSDTRYDEMGRLARKSVPVILPSPLDAVPATHFAETYYDVAGRVVRLVTPDSNAPDGRSETTTTYNGLTTTVTMPPNVSNFQATREEIRNALGEIIQSKDGTGLRACYAYDAHGNLSNVWRNDKADCGTTPPATVLTSVVYDDLGRKTSMVDQDKGTWRYAYNAAGEVIREITARSQCIEYLYDARGRVVTRTDRTTGSAPDAACGGTIESESVWTYDTAANGFGQPASEKVSTTDPLDATNTLRLLQDKTFAYDGFGRASSTTTRMLPNTPAARSYTNARTYDEYGRLFQDLLTSPEFPASGALYEYTDSFPTGASEDDPNLAEGHLRKVRDATGQRRGLAWHEIINVDAFGTVIEERRGESAILQTLRTTDDRTGRLATIRTNGGQLQNWSVQWDAAGNVRSRANSAAGANPGETFAYDVANRLVGVTATVGNSTESYAYSVTGNLTSRAGGTIHYGSSRPAACQALPAPGPHAANAYVLGTNTVCYTYDASGNQVSAAGGGLNRTVLYSVADQARRMDSTIDNLGSRLAFEYGAGRERIRRRDYPTATATTPSSETHYVGGAEVVLTPANNCGSTRNVLVRREYAGAVLLQRSECATGTSTSNTSLAYRLVDHLGSTDALVTAAGVAVDSPAQQRFDAFGARRDATTWARLARPSAVTFNTATTRRGFTGHEQLDVAGLVHMNGRVYDPEIGRFVQADPIVQAPYNPQSLNRYSYVMNNPLGTTDPTGYVGRPKWLNYAMQAVALYVTIQTGINIATIGELYGAAGLSAFSADIALMSAGSGALSGMASTGSPKGALMGAITPLAFMGVGQAASALGFGSGSIARAGMHGVAGGVLAELQGGNFGHGFMRAGLTKFLSANLPVPGGGMAAGAIHAVVIGGTVDELTGGKFANGAKSAAWQFVMNCLHDPECRARLEAADQARRQSAADIVDVFGGPISSAKSFFTNLMEGNWGALMLDVGTAGRGGQAKNAIKGLSMAGDAAKKPPIVIGENMDRVREYAAKVGGHAYSPWKLVPWDRVTALRRNERWVLDQRRAGREFIDIGPDFERRSSTGYVSDFYEMERRNLRGYGNHQKAFERSGSAGGVPGLDF